MAPLPSRGCSEPSLDPYARPSRLNRALSTLLLLALGACGAGSADSAAAPGSSCGDAGCFQTDGSADGGSDVSSDVGTGDAAQEAAAVHPLCGTGCVPDDPNACIADGGAAIDSGVDSGDDDAAGSAPPDDGADAAYSKSPQPIPGPPDAGPAGCRVTSGPGGYLVARCMAAGAGQDKAPCVTSEDCAPGFACVGDSSTGSCQPYCCGGMDVCPAGMWCTERMSRDALGENPSLTRKLPVCTDGDACTLLPAAGGPNGCPDDLVCTVVRNDGTLACLPPGTLGEGETCDSGELRCAEGFVCSRATMKCLKLCRIDSDDCGSGVCQAGTTGLPDQIGICVGGERR